MTRPTQGPYRFTLDPVEINATIRGFGGQNVATVWSGKACSLDVVRANAALLTASADLRDTLSALVEAVRDRQRLHGEDIGPLLPALKAAEAALRKAGG